MNLYIQPELPFSELGRPARRSEFQLPFHIPCEMECRRPGACPASPPTPSRRMPRFTPARGGAPGPRGIEAPRATGSVPSGPHAIPETRTKMLSTLMDQNRFQPSSNRPGKAASFCFGAFVTADPICMNTKNKLYKYTINNNYRRDLLNESIIPHLMIWNFARLKFSFHTCSIHLSNIYLQESMVVTRNDGATETAERRNAGTFGTTERRNDGDDGTTERRNDGTTERRNVRNDGTTERRNDGTTEQTMRGTCLVSV